MKRSKYIFIILSCVYIFIAILFPFNILNISKNLLFALSLSALLTSTSDLIYKIGEYLNIANTYNANLKLTIDYLNIMIDQGRLSNKISLRNIKENLNQSIKSNYTFIHPNEFIKKRIVKYINITSIVLFIIGISSFIIIPFVIVNLTTKNITSIVTILAFSSMTFILFFDELIYEKQANINKLLNNEHVIIQTEYPDFSNYFNLNMYYRNDLLARQDFSKNEEQNDNPI